MLATIIMWVLLLPIVVVFGNALWRWTVDPAAWRPGDRWMITLWMGLIALCLLLETIALFVPLGPYTIPGLFLLCVVAVFFCASTRNVLRTTIQRVGWSEALVVVAFVLVASALSVQVIVDVDAVSYHFDQIHWLSETGLVPGLGLVHDRLGFTSAWLTIPAAFNHGWLYARTGLVANGFAMLLVVSHLYIGIVRVLRGKAVVSDWFILLSLPIPVLYPLYYDAAASTSPDFPVTLLIMLVTWLILMNAERSSSDRIHALPVLFLSVAALTMKLTMLPLAGVAFVYYVGKAERRTRAVMRGVLIGVVMFLPVLCASVKTTGFLCYPANIYFDLPWTLTQETVAYIHEITFRISAAMIGTPESMEYFTWEWFTHWFGHTFAHRLTFILSVLSIVASAWAVLSKRYPRDVLWVALFTMGGIVFLFAKGPNFRYGLGYFTAFLCLLVAYPCSKYIKLGNRLKRPASITVAAVVLASSIVVTFSLYGETFEEKELKTAIRSGELKLAPGPHLLLPPVIPLVHYFHGLEHAYPVCDHSTSAKLWTPFDRPQFFRWETEAWRTELGFRFRRPDEGARGGFVRLEEGEK